MNRRVFLNMIAVSAALPTLSACAARSGDDIVDIAAGNSGFDTLVAALQAGGLVETLRGDGPFTVFAPTDEAFAALPEGTVEDLLKPENKDRLVEVLTYHVVPGSINSDALVGRRLRVATVEGRNLHIDGRDGVSVNGIPVVQPDIFASNGIIHVLGGVLIPS